MKKALVLITILLLVLATFPMFIFRAKSNPGTIIVPDDYPTIQEAINNAREGDTIFVKAGIYDENLVVNKTLSIVGENAATAIIEGKIRLGGGPSVVTVTAPDVMVEEFTIQSGWALLTLQEQNGIFKNLIIRDGDWAGIYCYGDGNIILNNTISSVLFGILSSGFSKNTIISNHITNCSVVGIFLEGARAHTIVSNKLANNTIGVVASVSNSVISNNTIANNVHGLLIQGGKNNIFVNNTISFNDIDGIALFSTCNATLSDNKMNGNKYNFGVFGGSDLSAFIHNIDTSNVVNGKPVYYLINQNGVNIQSATFANLGYLGIINSTYVSLQDINLTANGEGVLLAHTANSSINAVNVSGNDIGIVLYSCSSVTIANSLVSKNGGGFLVLSSSNISILNNEISLNRIRSSREQGTPLGVVPPITSRGEGIRLESSVYNTINRNNISSNGGCHVRAWWAFGCGIFFHLSSYNTVSQNIITFNKGDGIHICSSSNNSIIENNISRNGDEEGGFSAYHNTDDLNSGIALECWKGPSTSQNIISGNTISNHNYSAGIYVSSYPDYLASDNTIYQNNFINNTRQVLVSLNNTNQWNDTHKGNYWSDYAGVDFKSGRYQNETGSDGIGDTPYIIDENNQDNYPLMNMITPSLIPTLVSINYPYSIEIGEWATITVKARNDGAKADEMYISVSLPDNPLIDGIQTVSHDLQDAYILPVGSEVSGDYGTTYPIVLEYPLVEGFKENWETGETKTLQFKVKPQNPGTFRFFVKTTAQINGEWSYDPPSGTKDQQNEYVYVYELEVQSAQIAEWTYMVYLDGDIDREDEALRDLNEMEEIGSTSGVNVIALLDRIPGHDDSNDDWTNTRLYYVTKDDDTSVINSQLLEDLGEMNMGSDETLSWFITYAETNYPARHYALVLMDHGGGFREVMKDETNGDFMKMTELKKALTDADLRLDVLAFEACLMGMTEVAYQVKDYANFMVGSEDYIRGFPLHWHLFPHDKILSELTNNPLMNGRELAGIMVDKFREAYKEHIEQKQTLSAIDLSKVVDLTTKINNLASALTDKLDLYYLQIKTVRSLIASSNEEYGKQTPLDPQDDLDYIDLYYYAQLIEQYIEDEAIQGLAVELMDLITNEVIVAEWHQVLHPNSHGLSISFPETIMTYRVGINFDYNKLDFALLDANGWDEFLKQYLEKVSCEVNTFTRPIGGLEFRVDSFIYITPNTLGLFKGTHLLSVAPLVFHDSKIMVFDHWEDENGVTISESPTFYYDLQIDKQLSAIYKSLLSGTMVELDESQSKIYLHLYDNSGNHLGLNYETNQTEIDIPESFYFDFQNGTILIVIPDNIDEFRVVADARYAEEQFETYNLTISTIKNGLVSNQTSVTYSIRKGEQQEFAVKITPDGRVEIAPYSEDQRSLYLVALVVIFALFIGGSSFFIMKRRRSKRETLSSAKTLSDVKP